MFSSVFKKEELPPVQQTNPGLMYKSDSFSPSEMREIERAFVRLFATEDGQKVLAYLQVITFNRALGAGSTDEQLRYLEGQRSLVATILRLINRGRNG